MDLEVENSDIEIRVIENSEYIFYVVFPNQETDLQLQNISAGKGGGITITLSYFTSNTHQGGNCPNG